MTLSDLLRYSSNNFNSALIQCIILIVLLKKKKNPFIGLCLSAICFSVSDHAHRNLLHQRFAEAKSVVVSLFFNEFNSNNGLNTRHYFYLISILHIKRRRKPPDISYPSSWLLIYAVCPFFVHPSHNNSGWIIEIVLSLVTGFDDWRMFFMIECVVFNYSKLSFD